MKFKDLSPIAAEQPFQRSGRTAAAVDALLGPPSKTHDPRERTIFSTRINAAERELLERAAKVAPTAIRDRWRWQGGITAARFMRLASLAVARRLVGLPELEGDRELVGPRKAPSPTSSKRSTRSKRKTSASKPARRKR